MRAFKVLAAAWVCGIAMTAAAHAADPAETWRPEFKKPHYTDLISGWYVRVDGAYRTNSIRSVDAPAPNNVTAWSIHDTWAVGAGAGYKYKWFRSDVTLDFAKRAQFYGDTAATSQFYSVKIDALTILANVYLDMGTWAGLTPYVGAGAGMTNLRTHEFTTTPNWEGVVDGSKWNPSWAAMGGVSYQFSPTLLLDVSYRYLKMGDAVSGTLPPTHTTRVTFRDMTAQEIRVGLRLMLD